MMKAIREHRLITVCIIAAVILTAVILAADLRQDERGIKRQAKAIRQAIEERALQCYVIEDAYPESLSYLEDNYGLTVNKDDYKIVYHPFAENMPPEIRVIYKGE